MENGHQKHLEETWKVGLGVLHDDNDNQLTKNNEEQKQNKNEMENSTPVSANQEEDRSFFTPSGK